MKLWRRETGQEFELRDGLIVGRMEDCALCVADASVSRQHARVEERAGAWWVVDLGSSNGTKQNGRRLAEFRLQRGDLVTFGTVAFDVLDAAPAAAPPRPAAAAPDREERAAQALAEAERARIRAQLQASRRSSGWGDLSQQPWWVRCTAGLLALAFLAGVILAVRYASRLF